MIAIPRLPIGNVASVQRMVERVGGVARIVDEPEELAAADKVIIAGVGAFDFGMRCITDLGWAEPLRQHALERGIPTLGICLGMQLMCERSEEGELSGFGWIEAQVKRFEIPPGSQLRVPHMGWNTVAVTRPNALLNSNGAGPRFYFVHSYHVVCQRPDIVVATASHGHCFTAAFQRDNLYGVQFHPEKSHRYGMEVIKRFVYL